MNKIIAIIFLTISLYAKPRISEFPELECHKTEDTLLKITEIIANKQKGAYLRFGDGDINLAYGGNDSLQKGRRELMTEMQEAFRINGPTVLKALPLGCRELNGYEEGMSPGNHEAPFDWCLNILNKAKPLWGQTITDVYSPVALHFALTNKPKLALQFLKFLKKSPCYMFVGNANVPAEIREILFGKNCIYIPTPPQDSYQSVDSIEKACLEHIADDDDYKIIVTAMGCSGRVFQKRLWKKLNHIFLFDFGSALDALCGWHTRAWIDLTQFNEKTFLDSLTREVKILCTAALIDTDYENRKQEYTTCLETLQKYGYDNPFIIESIKTASPSFLTDYSCNIIHPNVNNPLLRNKGVNESRAIAKSWPHLPFQDNDMIVKITGRYAFSSNQFLKTIEENPLVDAFVKTAPDGQVYTFCYAMRAKYFKDMLDQLDYEKMEREMINIEQEVANYIQKIIKTKNAQVMFLDELGITANIFGNGQREKLEL